jgi:hypothetical protein
MLRVDIEQQSIRPAALIDETVLPRRLQAGEEFVEPEKPGGMDEM